MTAARLEAPLARLAFMGRALRSRNYRLFFFGQMISLLGTWMTQIATTWLVYRLTNSAFLLGAVGFAGQLPAFLMSPFAGVWIDRWDRHRLLILTQVLSMVQSLLLAVLALSGLVSIWMVLVLLAFQGLINAFDMPARQSFVIEMVEDKADLPNAIALNSTMFNLARLLGPSLGGMLIYLVGEGWCFLIDGVSYIAVILCLLAMRVSHRDPGPRSSRPLQELQAGYRYAFDFGPIRAILLLMAAMSLVGMPYGVVLPVIARETMGGGANTLGFLMAASGLGALAAALVLAARRSVLGLGKVIPLCTWGFGLAMLLLSQASGLALALPLLFLTGFTLMQQNAACNTLLQTIVDSDKRGRVMSLYTMAFMGMAPLGSLWAGALADRFGPHATLLVSAAGSLLIGTWFWQQLPALREAVRPIYRDLGILPQVAAGLQKETNLSQPPERVG